MDGHIDTTKKERVLLAELVAETSLQPTLDGSSPDAPSNGSDEQSPAEPSAPPRGCGCGPLLWVVAGIITIFGFGFLGQILPWQIADSLKALGMSIPWFVRPTASIVHMAIVVNGMLLLLKLWRPPPRYRAIFEAWMLAGFFSLFLVFLRLIPAAEWPETAIPGLALQFIGLVLFWIFLRWRVGQNPQKQWTPFGRPGPTPFILIPLLMAGWFWVGEFGSFTETVLQVLLGLFFGRVAVLLLEQWIFLPLSTDSRGLSNDFALGGWASSATLYWMGTAFSLNGQLLVLPLILLLLAWPVTGLLLAQKRQAGAGWLLGIAVALAFAFSDADEMTILLLTSLNEIPGQMLIAAWITVAVSIIGGYVMWLLRNRSFGVVTGTAGWIAALLLWAGAATLYFLGGVPGFHGDRLLVIFEKQADVTAAEQIANINARRAYIYTTLVDHADNSQNELRFALDNWRVDYQPYYLVNAVEVEGGWPLQWWLARFDGVDRVLQSPVMRPVAAMGAPALGDLVAPTETQWNLTSIGADRVWNELNVRGSGITIGQSDSGVQFDHPDLMDSYRGRDGNHNFNWLDPWMGKNAPYDLGGHGTHTLGSAVGNSVGVAPDAEWFACANLVRNLANPALYLDCMQFMLAPYPYGGDPLRDGAPTLAADVLNNSWGCPTLEGCDVESLRTGVDALRAAGIFVTAAAGNEGLGGCETVASPLAIYENVYSVGAVDEFGVAASFSSRGPVTVDGSGRTKPDILAPGVDVLSATPGNSYAVYDGTSMAGPHVAGTVALMWSANPALLGQINRTEQILAETAHRYDSALDEDTCGRENEAPNNVAGYGVLDAFAAVERALAE